MNTIDRIVGILYKEMSFGQIMHTVSELKSQAERIDYQEFYNLKNEKFRKRITETYSNQYYQNYHDNEITIILDWVINESKSNILSSSTNNEKCITALHLLKNITQKYLFKDREGISVSFENLLDWNGLINKIDYNIFLSAYSACFFSNQSDDDQLYITHNFTGLKEVLKKGISENHMHLKGSGYSVDLSWIAFVTESFSNHDFYSKNLQGTLEHLSKNEQKEEDLSYSKLKVMHFYLWALYRSEIVKDIDHLKKISISKIMKVITSNHQTFLQIFIDKNTKDFLEYWQQDYINVLNQNIIDNPFFSIQIQRYIYRYIFEQLDKISPSSLQLFIFHVYLMGVNQFKLNLIQDNKKMGFIKFKKSEDIKNNFIESASYFKENGINADALIYQSVFDKYYREKNVFKVELRVTPRSFGKLKKIVDEMDAANTTIHNKRQYRNLKKISYGIIFHYIKFDKNETSDYRHSRYKEMVEETSKFVQEIYDYKTTKEYDESSELGIHYNNYYINKLVGIDTANYEIGFRPELFVKIYKYHKEDNKKGYKIGFTYHVGEDFLTLASGLRAIDDVVEFLGFERNDRLGHAIALGLNVDKYFDFKRNKINTSVEEYIDDIVWMHQLIIENQPEKVNLQKYLITEFEKWKYQLLPAGYTELSIFDYYQFYKIRGAEIKNENHPSWYLYQRYYYDLTYHNNAKKPLVLDAGEQYIKCVKVSQEILRQKIIKKSISIETNPSSNYKISVIRKYIDLPLFKFNKYHLNEEHSGNINVSINTDDSSIFQTNLYMEYSLVAAALFKEGYSEDRILDYINHIREMSIYQSFIK